MWPFTETPFHQTRDWRKLAKEHKCIERKNNNWKCVDCGFTGDLESDHILPVSQFWGMRLHIKNLALRCSDCNKKKGAKIILTPKVVTTLTFYSFRKVIVRSVIATVMATIIYIYNNS